ncbi:acetyl-CoA carboxylase biotin carboxylase subunit family protein [Streptomyces sp. NPDC087908]|uniref:ATP-grasp domain-containing protein n=1 Tax=Streptomyces sp. NPDC087908 TaxID=3365820 RepID=UPI003814766F
MIALIDVAEADGLPDLLEVADDWCEVVVVNASETPWTAEQTAMLDDVVPYLDAAGLDIDELCRRLAEHGVDGVLTFSDEMIPTVSSVAERLGLPYNSPETAAAITHKNLQRLVLDEAGLQQQRHATFQSEEELAAAVRTVGFPAVLKPVYGNGSTNVFAVDDEQQLRAALVQAAEGAPAGATRFDGIHGFGEQAPWQLEERLVGVAHPIAEWLGDYVSVETLTLGPGDHWHFWVTDRLPLLPPFREGGLGGPTLLPEDQRDEVCAFVARALTALGVMAGITHTEVKLTADGPRIIEVNGRLGGFLRDVIPKVSDINPILLAMQAAVGSAVRRPVRSAGYSYAVFIHGPVGATRVRALADPAELLAVPGVWRVDVRTSPGASIDARVGTRGRPQTVWLTAATPEALCSAVAVVHHIVAEGNEFDVPSAGLAAPLASISAEWK